jgi:hypothetical protein
MVSLEWAAGLGRAIPENWFPELLAMSEEKAIAFSKRFPAGAMEIPQPEPVKKAAPKKAAKKTPAKSKSE